MIMPADSDRLTWMSTDSDRLTRIPGSDMTRMSDWLGSDSDVRLGWLVQAADGLDVTRISDSDLNSDARLEFPTRMPDSDVTRMFDSDA